MTTVTTRTGTCEWCGVKVELDVSTGPGVWIDEDVQDSANEGARCAESDSGSHEVVEAPDCSAVMISIRFAGITPEGAEGGATAGVEDLAWFVKTRFDYGWYALDVHRISDDVLVGQIHEVDGRRVWWAENTKVAAS